jgi:hypothetical protein
MNHLTILIITIVILAISQLVTFWLLYKFKKELNEKTFLFWEEDGDFKVLKNSKGDIITKL